MVFRSKAQCEGNGHALVEHWNATAEHHRGALWVSLSTPTVCVTPLDKGLAIACEARLAVGVDKLTESVIITLIEHSPVLHDVCLKHPFPLIMFRGCINDNR